MTSFDPTNAILDLFQVIMDQIVSGEAISLIRMPDDPNKPGLLTLMNQPNMAFPYDLIICHCQASDSWTFDLIAAGEGKIKPEEYKVVLAALGKLGAGREVSPRLNGGDGFHYHTKKKALRGILRELRDDLATLELLYRKEREKYSKKHQLRI